METLTPPASAHERISFGKIGATLGVVLATTVWVAFAICLVPILAIGFLLPLTPDFIAKTRRISGPNQPHPSA